ncbi:MAG: hypothetical protein HOM14_13350 [Gammaproteobacteria bacterium]|jgi:hypothetical protein|nr:hypothetical protein [Gammaproteobacteria bacterium]MBT3722537.1 hypothetical protein [Gammaproteobacteria bacterium]MBT4193992.1 hypothetical protein [Gammaproteobacteria bacterium]MBT4450634.1 hypothetical protein [Gammaproteobacteria bacterium]MBT4863325.1 hypothetical protein [Gammaproteobacteria bacterium]
MSFYFIFKITQSPGNIVKGLEKVAQFDSFKEAKQHVKLLRVDKSSDELALYKIIFAESELNAEQLLQEKREQPIIEEWEK